MSNFQDFFEQLSETNLTLDSFTDFNKIRANIKPITIRLNQLNYLLGKENLAEAVNDLYQENPNVFEALGILIAVRKEDKKKTLNSNGIAVFLDSYFTSAQSVIEFIEQTGLAEVFQNKEITNLVDYVFGIEVGLDSNARKNRSGKNMAKAVASLLGDAGIPFKSEVSSADFPVIKSLGTDIKRFDFVIETNRKTYLVETNFYNRSGSKPNEVARSYSEIASKIQQYPQFEFVWVTDGQGWHSARNKLEEAYKLIPSVYNLKTLEKFIQKLKEELV